ncbi:DNA polymerase III subunit beta [Ancylobacter sonchi]|uniref:DNA polymerase III subunit beta n=1 Tax=Ancylobacter sonchi TaxID=1937790 RepID=UPI001BD623D9|nr:DNA polymerase III subunit beta [Ancylobacter sonchi]MBS7532195.1 DNA polymerase III subunit beta [Ancylobacter sonchi]
MRSAAGIGHLANSRAKIPALSHIRFRAEAGQRLALAATDLDAYAETDVPAEVQMPGEIALPADKLQKMVRDFAEGSQVSIDVGPAVAVIRAGRSRYQAPYLTVDQFPEMFEPGEAAACFTLMPEEVIRLFDLPRPAAAKDMPDRLYLEGVYLHKSDDGAALWGVAGNGYVLLGADAPMPPGGDLLPELVLPSGTGRGHPRGIMIPLPSVEHLLKMGDAGLEISAGTNVLTAQSLGSPRIHYATKLIENRFPPYERVVPAFDGPCATVEGGLFSAAIKRLAGMAGDDKRPILMRWGEGDEEMSLSLEEAIDSIGGTERVELIESRGEAYSCINVTYLARAIDAVGRGRIEIYATRGRNTRIRNLDDDQIIACVAPINPKHPAPPEEDAA